MKIRNIFFGSSISGHFRGALLIMTVLGAFTVIGLQIFQYATYYKYAKEQFDTARYNEIKGFSADVVNYENERAIRAKRNFDKAKLREIESKAKEVHTLMKTIYRFESLGVSDKELLRNITQAINSHTKGWKYSVYITTLDGHEVLYPNSKNNESKDLISEKDKYRNNYIANELKFLEKKDEGFLVYNNKDHKKNKIAFVKKFSELDVYISTMCYPFDFHEDIYRELVNGALTERFSYGGSVFIFERTGKVLVLEKESYLDNNYNLSETSDTLLTNIYKKLCKAVENNPNGAYVKYNWHSKDIESNDLQDKTAYVRYNEQLDLIIGIGFYKDLLNKDIKGQAKIIEQMIIWNIFQIIIVVLIVISLEIYLSKVFTNHLERDFISFFKFFEGGVSNLNYMLLKSIYFSEFKKLGKVVNKMIRSRQKVVEDLIIEQEKAKQSDRLKSAFLANISHEIRTPMNAIVGFSSLLSTDLEQKERKEFVKLIKQSGDDLMHLLDSIIDMSKIETGQIEINESLISLNDGIIDNIEERYKKIINNKNLNITFKIKNNISPYMKFKIDIQRLKQILFHLLDNAFKFTEKGNIQLFIYRKEEKLYFEISDTGIGISEKNIDTIFNNFSQVENTLSRGYRGAGVGLPVCYKLIKIMQGKIWVESKLGEGSTFKFYLPIRF